MTDCCKHGNELSGSIKGKEFLNQLKNEQQTTTAGNISNIIVTDHGE